MKKLHYYVYIQSNNSKPNSYNKMKNRHSLAAVALICMLTAACTKPAEPVSTFDLEKAKAGINEANQKFMAGVSSGDSASVAALYHSQATLSPANSDAISGADKISSYFGGASRAGFAVKLQTSNVWGNADVLVEEGTFELSNKDGAHVDHGKYIVLWKEENGQWKLYRDIWNSNMPMTQPETAKK
jgi:ketosteroid isomerase-like protein